MVGFYRDSLLSFPACWILIGQFKFPAHQQYRIIYSNKPRDAYLIFRASSAALIRGRRLFEGGPYLKTVPDKFTFSIFLFNGTLSRKQKQKQETSCVRK